MPIWIHGGTMGAKKSTKLIEAKNDFKLGGIECEAFNYSFNTRYGGASQIKTHCGSKTSAISVYNTQEMHSYLKEHGFFKNLSQGSPRRGILIEEGQFSDEKILDFLKEYKGDFDIHMSMLMRDFGAMPFRLRSADGGSFSNKTTSDIVNVADFVKVNGNPVRCTYSFDNGNRCRQPAFETQKFVRLTREKLWTLAPYDPDHVIEIGGVGSDAVEEEKEKEKEKPYEVIYKPRDGHFIEPIRTKWDTDEDFVILVKSIYKERKGRFFATQAL